jgi:glutamate/tyrosine decarboxylase-like PLP-dependent enzyme
MSERQRGTPGDALPTPVAALFPGDDARRTADDFLTQELMRAARRVATASIVPTVDVAEFNRELDGFDFEAPQPLATLLDWTIRRMEHGIVQMSNPRYFGLYNPGPNFPSQCADRISSAFNPQLASSASSPVPVALEAHMIRSVAARAGMKQGAAGHFATGGSEANFTALLCALTAAHPGFATDGARGLPGAPVFYTSRECHIAWLKIAHQAGVGRSALRLIGTNGRGEMDPAALTAAIAADRDRGAIPIMIVATAGTTGGGMIDPLEACAAIAERESLWFHVDAAWGGAALASPRLRPLLAGIERADSITIDAHKWFATTMGCAMYLTRRPRLLSEAFHCSTTFMPSSVASVDPYLTSIQWSRRFMGLRLFLSLAAAGWAGYAAHVERSVAVIDRIRAELVEREWSVANASSLAVLNVVPPGGATDVRNYVKRVVASGSAWVAPTTFEGRDVVRICATHGATTEADIDALIAALQRHL